MIKAQNIRDKLVTQVAQELQHPEGWVDKVISHQFRHANEALKTFSEVEISGFGTFHISQAKLKRRINKYEEIQTALNQKTTTTTADQKKLDNLATELAYFYKRLKS